MAAVLRFPLAAVVAVGAALVVGNVSAFAYTSGSLGYDISYPQCGTVYPRNMAQASPPASNTSLRAWWSTLRNPPATRSTPVRSWYPGSSFGIVGVNSGYPFMSPAHPGNPCLADEYGHAPLAGLYINTGFDPSYTDSSHTTAHCASLSGAVAGSTPQRQAWAVGCSEAEKDIAYVQSRAITNPTAWWLDVENGNSWCGLHGVNCDQTLNQFTIQGIIDTLRSNVASPVGIYSNASFWSEIVGNLPVTGATWDWVASGTSTAQQAKTYCGKSFSGATVSLVQFVSGSIDRDVAC
jgi:hypothetical protein